MTGRKRERFSEEDWEMINAYAHGYGYGVSGLRLNNLWQPDEEGAVFEKMGHLDGLTFFEEWGPLEGELLEWEDD